MVITHMGGQCFKVTFGDLTLAFDPISKAGSLPAAKFGADIAHICETAAERALMDSVKIGEPRMIGIGDLEAAIGEVKPSLGAWFDTARNVALFANENGSYADLAAYLRKRRLI